MTLVANCRAVFFVPVPSRRPLLVFAGDRKKYPENTRKLPPKYEFRFFFLSILGGMRRGISGSLLFVCWGVLLKFWAFLFSTARWVLKDRVPNSSWKENRFLPKGPSHTQNTTERERVQGSVQGVNSLER